MSCFPSPSEEERPCNIKKPTNGTSQILTMKNLSRATNVKDHSNVKDEEEKLSFQSPDIFGTHE